jgi:DNA-binding beta-propeller fold protein YncE
MKNPAAMCAFLALCAAAWLEAAPAAAPSQDGERWSIIARFPIGGNDTAYDYLRVDEAAQRLYVAHGSRVEVLGLPAGNRSGEVAGMHGVHGMEIIPELGKGYTSDGLDRTVTVFDRETLAVKGKIGPTGTKPDAIHYDPGSRRLFVVNGGDSGNVSVIDPVADKIVATVALGGGKLEQIAFDGRGHAFVNDEDQSVVHVFDTASLHKSAAWKLGACQEPTGMAIDAPRHRLYSVCGNRKLVAVDSDDGRVVATVAIGSGPDGVAYDAQRGLLFVSNRDGTLDVIRELSADRYQRIQVLPTGPGARTIAFDATTRRIYVPTIQPGPAVAGAAGAPVDAKTFAILAIAPGTASKGVAPGDGLE